MRKNEGGSKIRGICKRAIGICLAVVLGIVFIRVGFWLGACYRYTRLTYPSNQRWSINRLNGQTDIPLTNLQEGQLLLFEPHMHTGSVKLWITGESGAVVKMAENPFDHDAYLAIIPSDGDYTMIFDGKRASFCISISIAEDS